MTEPLSQCLYCGASLRPSVRFCEQCGAEVRSEQAEMESIPAISTLAEEKPSSPPPAIGSPPPQTPPAWTPPTPPAAAWTPPPEPAPKKSRGGLWMACLVLLILLCLFSICGVVGYFLVSQPDFLSSLGIF